MILAQKDATLDQTDAPLDQTDDPLEQKDEPLEQKDMTKRQEDGKLGGGDAIFSCNVILEGIFFGDVGGNV